MSMVQSSMDQPIYKNKNHSTPPLLFVFFWEEASGRKLTFVSVISFVISRMCKV